MHHAAPHRYCFAGSFCPHRAFGPIRLGANRRDIFDLLGRPGDWSILPESRRTKSPMCSSIWKYGNVEFHFIDDVLLLIHFDSLFGKPRGERFLRIRPWIIREGMRLNVLKNAMMKSEIGYKTAADTSNPDCVEIVTDGKVAFLVQVKGAREDSGLKMFGHSTK